MSVIYRLFFFFFSCCFFFFSSTWPAVLQPLSTLINTLYTSTAAAMQSLPPIRSAVANSSTTEDRGVSDVASLAATIKTRGTTASAADGINRNRLRQEAGRRVQHITHGVAEQQTYLHMLQHIREQFAHTSQEPLQPLVLPPQWPSTARPREPQKATFSHGIALYKNLQNRNDTACLADGGAATVPVKARRPSVRKATEVAAADSTASSVPTELPSTSTNFAREHRWETADVERRTFFQRRLPTHTPGSSAATVEEEEKSMSVFGGRRGSGDCLQEVDLSPLDGLPTLEAKVAYLLELETASRQHILAYEKWDQQVISEMMAVRYVTFVLKPCMDALRFEETEEREKIYQDEDCASFYLFHESPLITDISEEIKAMKARELQLDRILNVTATAAQPLRSSQPSGSVDDSNNVSMDSESAGCSRSSCTTVRGPNHSLTPVPSFSNAGSGAVPVTEARRILQQYVRQRHGSAIDAAVASATATTVLSPVSPSAAVKTWSPAANATYPGTADRDPVRRSSALVLPPLPSAHAPRRNAVGIADYVALLDECMSLREHLIRTEEQARDDLNRACYEEQQVVLEWQRRRVHLERLVYWRQQREVAVQDEVAALTEVNVGDPLDPKVALLLELLEGEEEDTRAAICDEERRCCEEELWATDKALRDRHARLQLEQACRTAFERDVQTAEALAAQRLLVAEEASARQVSEAAAMQQLTAELRHGMAQLHVLYEVSISPEREAALGVLQSAFRRSLRGQLGWRATNSAVGRAINDARNRKKIMSGKRALQSFKDTLAAEEAQLMAEQTAQDVREQHVLFTGEAADRVAISSEQDLIRQGIRRASVLHVAEVYRPIFQRLYVAEGKARMQLEVAEEVDDEALHRSHAALTDIVTRKARTRCEETASRKVLVAEERGLWRELRSTEADAREELRLQAEAEEATRQADRATFATAALQASRQYREAALAAYVRQMTDVELEMLGCGSADSAERWSICAEEAAAATLLFSSLSLQACEVYAQTLLMERQDEMSRTHRQALCVAETGRRADLLLNEAIEWEALQPMLTDALSGPLRDLIVRRGAVNAISTWYNALRNGDIGRAVSRRQLHEDLARYRDERNLREQLIAQRLHTQQVREQLDALMREVQQEEVEALQQQLDILVHREEPREREAIDAMQAIVFGIIVRNAEAHTADVRNQLVNTEALLWQQESYERKLLVKASRREFKELMEREKLQLNEDYFAARIQRTWAAYTARKRYAQAMAEQQSRLIALEQQARAAVQLEELEEVALRVCKPCDMTLFFHAHVQQSLWHAYEKLCATVLAATSAREWQERVLLLWEMRYDLCDCCLCAEEERARRVLVADFNKPFLLQGELVQTEAQERRSLAEERTAFLMRILAREEQACRQAVAAKEAEELAEAKKEIDETQSSAVPKP